MIVRLAAWYYLRRAKKYGMQVGERFRVTGLVYFGREEAKLIRIGNHVSIAHGVEFLNHDGSLWVVRELFPSSRLNRFGTIEICDNCFIGERSILLPNIRIGPNSVVGAGSVVRRDVPPNVVVAGNPARVITTIEAFSETVAREAVFREGRTRSEFYSALWERHARSRS
jgi:acetyltransferase-like isoleucine patch superfamily enzyme